MTNDQKPAPAADAAKPEPAKTAAPEKTAQKPKKVEEIGGPRMLNYTIPAER